MNIKDGLCCWYTVYIKIGDRQTDRQKEMQDRQTERFNLRGFSKCIYIYQRTSIK